MTGVTLCSYCIPFRAREREMNKKRVIGAQMAESVTDGTDELRGVRQKATISKHHRDQEA